MELYKIIATINNSVPGEIFELAYLPENFEGAKISQSFSFVPPIGFNPKFSVDTMRIIGTDKVSIDLAFDAYGLETDVTFLIKKLNASGLTYNNIAAFAIDFTSYEKLAEFSEFALKSVSVIDYYNNIKNTEIQLALEDESNLPNTQNFINYVSLKSESVQAIDGLISIFKFMKNNEAKIFNSDFSIFRDITFGESTITGADVYDFISETESGIIKMSASFSGKLKFSCSANTIVDVKLKKTDFESGFSTDVLIINSFNALSGVNEFSLTDQIIDLTDTYNSGEQFFIAIESYTGYISLADYTQSFFVDFKINTDVPVIGSISEKVNYISCVDVIQNIFNGSSSIATYLSNYALTSAMNLVKKHGFINLKPSEFINDFTKATGSIFNFKTDGGVEFKYINTYFNELLQAENAIEITDFKDVSIKYSSDLTLSSVSVGSDKKEYEVYTYPINWNKILTFVQSNRSGNENLDLLLSKFRIDFSGMLDFFYKRSQQTDATSNDLFIFNKTFTPVWIDDDITIYDNFNPRDILTAWSKFLSFAFQNFGKNTLVLSSNGGTVDNLNISGVNQMDNLILNETPRLLPIEYNFTCLINDVDFSENILKINHEGEDVYLFVINAETTDKLSEQEIRALKIQLT